jgi:phosphoribosyl-AMP cyclohydrolase/phosphoribosyl-ATP pyrophosphohydrolase/phosphoribosyl-AMP cyclohydrolase
VLTATPIDATDEQLALVKYDDAGLVPAIVQEAGTGQVLMMAWMNAETLRMSLTEGRTVFWSRSRQEVWRKGDTSGDRQFVREAYYDCVTLRSVVRRRSVRARRHGRAATVASPTASLPRDGSTDRHWHRTRRRVGGGVCDR